MPSKRPTKIINVVFTEEDRQNAQDYGSNYACLLATALTRMGFKDVCVGSFGDTSIGKCGYAPQELFECDLVRRGHAARAPFYKKSVVGKKLTLIRYESA